MKFQRIILSIYGTTPFPLQRFSIPIYYAYSFTALSVIVSVTYVRCIYSENFREEFGIAEVNKISDVFVMVFILSTSLVHFVLQVDSLLKYNQYFKVAEAVERITEGVKVSKKCIFYEMTHAMLLILGIYTNYMYFQLEGFRGLLHLRITWSEICCRMKILQYSLFVEIIDGCLSKALSRLSSLRSFGASRSKEAAKELVDIQKYLRRVNEFEEQIFKYLGTTLLVSFVFEACIFIILMYISLLAITEWGNSKVGESSRISVLFLLQDFLIPAYSYAILYSFTSMLFPCWVSQVCIQKVSLRCQI